MYYKVIRLEQSKSHVSNHRCHKLTATGCPLVLSAELWTRPNPRNKNWRVLHSCRLLSINEANEHPDVHPWRLPTAVQNIQHLRMSAYNGKWRTATVLQGNAPLAQVQSFKKKKNALNVRPVAESQHRKCECQKLLKLNIKARQLSTLEIRRNRSGMILFECQPFKTKTHKPKTCDNNM